MDFFQPLSVTMLSAGYKYLKVAYWGIDLLIMELEQRIGSF